MGWRYSSEVECPWLPAPVPPKKIKKKETLPELGMVVHACNPSTWEAETGGSGFVASLSYLVRSSAT